MVKNQNLRCGICLRGFCIPPKNSASKVKREADRIQCLKCGVKAHKKCLQMYYHLQGSPKKWKCGVCTEIHHKECEICGTSNQGMLWKESGLNGRAFNFDKEYLHLPCTLWYPEIQMTVLDSTNPGKLVYNDPKTSSKKRFGVVEATFLQGCNDCVGRSNNKSVVPCIFTGTSCNSYYHQSCLINKHKTKDVQFVICKINSLTKIMIICSSCVKVIITNTGGKSLSKSKTSKKILEIVNAQFKKDFSSIQAVEVLPKQKIISFWSAYFLEEANLMFDNLDETMKDTTTNSEKLDSFIQETVKEQEQRKAAQIAFMKSNQEYVVKAERPPKNEELERRSKYLCKLLQGITHANDKDFTPKTQNCAICKLKITTARHKNDYPLFCSIYCGQTMHASCYFGTDFATFLIDECDEYDVESFEEIVHKWTCSMCSFIKDLPESPKVDYYSLKDFNAGNHSSQIPQCKYCHHKGGPLRYFEHADTVTWFHPYCKIVSGIDSDYFCWASPQTNIVVSTKMSCQECLKKGSTVKCLFRDCDTYLHIPCAITSRSEFYIKRDSHEIRMLCKVHSSKGDSPIKLTRRAKQKLCSKAPRKTEGQSFCKQNKKSNSSLSPMCVGNRKVFNALGEESLKVNWNQYSLFFGDISPDDVMARKKLSNTKVDIDELCKLLCKSQENLPAKDVSGDASERIFRAMIHLKDDNTNVSERNRYFLCQFKQTQDVMPPISKYLGKEVKLTNEFTRMARKVKGQKINIKSLKKSSIRNVELTNFCEKSKKQFQNMKEYNRALHQTKAELLIKQPHEHRVILNDEVGYHIYSLSLELNRLSEIINKETQKSIEEYHEKEYEAPSSSTMARIEEEAHQIDYSLRQVTPWKKIRRTFVKGLTAEFENGNKQTCCQICFFQDDDPHNLIHYCGKCGKGAHQACYGFQYKGARFKCDWCENGGDREALFKEQKAVLDVLLKSPNTTNQKRNKEKSIVCIVCHREGGLFKLLYSDKKHCRKYVHIFCCFTSSLQFKYPSVLTEFEDGVLQQIEHPQQQQCIVCQERKGYMLHLYDQGIKTAEKVHSFCAWLAGFKFEHTTADNVKDGNLVKLKYYECFSFSIKIQKTIDLELRQNRLSCYNDPGFDLAEVEVDSLSEVQNKLESGNHTLSELPKTVLEQVRDPLDDVTICYGN
ncbi:unnamed protein product [Moneuplotes crassus]|uniref:Zinc finger PHD-type domain-containing protein n=1 Tax=Euplotes crassus TaxID=5936 RepID=A0AAD1X759_EUPCR|nr:unnamed protein product [Moneuplotes crassus]